MIAARTTSTSRILPALRRARHRPRFAPPPPPGAAPTSLVQHNAPPSFRHFRTLSKAAATAPPNAPLSDRWYAVPPANLVHLSVGSVYVYSMWTPGMCQSLGVVTSSSLDWTQAQVLPVFSTSAILLGLTTASLGTWVERVGPRRAGFVGSCFWGAGLCTTAAGIHVHSLELLYVGWGVLGGIGWGLMYLAPVTTVMKWFPDRRGLATGIALSAFGAGAAIAPAFIYQFVDLFQLAPDYIGPLVISTACNDPVVTLSTLKDGTQVVAEHSALGTPGQPVVVATASDVAKLPHVTTGAGAYALGTGDTGTARAMGALGLLYGALGMTGSRLMRMPHADWNPPELQNNKDQDVAVVRTNNIGLPVDYATWNTSQFPLLWLSVFGNATGGLALLTSSKLLITDVWTGIAPDIVTASFATGYVSAIGFGTAAGRFGWAALSDYLGRQTTYAVFGLGIPIIGCAPTLVHFASAHSNSSATTYSLLSAFCGGSVLAITFYGGVFSVLPAYISDLFGQKHAGAIHGKLLTAWACSAIAGPLGLSYLRSQSAAAATQNLLRDLPDAHAFASAFGCHPTDMDSVQTLIDAKTLTIPRIMELMPAGTVDPTPFLYDSTCYAAASLMAMSFCANLLIRPMDVPAKVKEVEASMTSQPPLIDHEAK